MSKWINQKLDDEIAAREAALPDDDRDLITPVPAEHKERIDKWRREGGLERAAADHGVIEPARELVRSKFPLLADLVQLPPLTRGKKYYQGTPSPRQIRAATAAEDVQRIRTIWKANYGKQNRRSSDGPSAIEIAAKRHRLKLEEIELYLKKFPRPKSPIS